MTEKFSVSVTTATGEKPYHAKRPHRKSRTGCTNCKKRKVKCDEGRPACRTCIVRKETCVYNMAMTSRASPTVSPVNNSSSSSSPDSRTTSPEPTSSSLAVVANRTDMVTQQPLFIPSGRNELDMRLLWFYTTATYASFASGSLKERSVDVVLKVNVVQHAFANPFLMNCLLGLSAMHINHLGITNMGITRAQEIHYRAKAFETYRKAVEAADPATYPALLATSLFLCGLSSHVFRGEDAKPLAILDWLILWKGIGAIIDFTQLAKVRTSGIPALMSRPAIDLHASAQCLPSSLLFMLASIKSDDPEFPLVQRYYQALQVLGSLYRELRNGGLSEMLLLRVATFPTYLSKQFIDAARARRPRALVILAHYLVFAKFDSERCWWMDGISDHEIPSIHRELGAQWEGLLRVPLAALQLHEDRDIVRLLLDDPQWDEPVKTSPEMLTSETARQLAIRAARDNEVSVEVEVSRRGKLQMDLCNPEWSHVSLDEVPGYPLDPA